MKIAKHKKAALLALLQIKLWDVLFFAGTAYLSDWYLFAYYVHQLESNVRLEIQWQIVVT